MRWMKSTGIILLSGLILFGTTRDSEIQAGIQQGVVVIPVTEARLVDAEKTPVTAVLQQVDGVSVLKSGTVYFRLPETLPAGSYWICFRMLQQGRWQNAVYDKLYHNARNFRVLCLTEPQKVSDNLWRADLCSVKPMQISPGDVVRARFDEAMLEALVLSSEKPATGHMKIGTNTWGMEYHKEYLPSGIDTMVMTGPDENRSGTARITAFNYKEKPLDVNVSWNVKDFFGKVIDRGNANVSIPSLGIQQWSVPYRVPEESDHLLITARLSNGKDINLHHTADVLADRITGPRPCLNLAGAWDFVADDALFLGTPPPAEKFQKNGVTVPGYMPLPSRGARHVGWYRKTIELPQWFKSERQFLVFGTVSYEYDVYLNGEKVGHHFGPKDSFEFDVTGKLRPWENELIVGVRDWVAAAPAEDLRRLAANPEWATWTSNQQFEISRLMGAAVLTAPSWDTQGGIKDDVFLEGRPAIHVKDVFIKPSVREKSISIDAIIVNNSDKPVSVTPVCTIFDRGKEVLKFSGSKVPVNPGEPSTITLKSPFPDASLWWPHDPHLLRCSITFQNGKDLVEVRFGFREVWLEENKFLFNGRVTKMTRTGYNPYSQSHMNRRTLREIIAGLPPFGVPIAEVSNSLQMSADVCDEEGLLWDMETNVTVCGAITSTLINDLYWKNAEALAGRTARSFRNHPCVVHYDHSNEFACFSPYTNVKDGYKYASRRLYGVYEAVKRIDPTLPGSSDADGDLDGRLPDFNLHYPMADWSSRTVNGHSFLVPQDIFNLWFEDPRPGYLPEKGDVMKVISNGLPYTWKYGTRPVYSPETLWCPFGYLPHGGTYWSGDAVYRSTYDCYQAEVERTERFVSGHRHIEMWLVHPWTGPWSTYQALRPDCIVPIESQHNYYSGGKVMRSVNIHHDRLFPAEFTLSWGVRLGDGDKEAGRENLKVSAGDLLRRKLEFILPEVNEPAEAKLVYRLSDTSGEVFSTAQPITIFPREKVQLQNKILAALWDPAATSREALTAIGVDIVSVADPAAIPSGTKILVVGAQAWNKENVEGTAKSILGFIENGGTVLLLRQTCLPEWLPVTVRLDTQRVSSRVWKRAPNHPVFKGINDDWLRDWQENHIVSSFDFSKPRTGNFIALADTGAKDGLERVCLGEMFYGTGRMILCQLHLMEAFNTEPVSSRLLVNLLSSAIMPNIQLGTIAVSSEPSAPVVGALKLIGAEVAMLTRPLTEANLTGHSVLLVQTETGLSQDEAGVLYNHVSHGGTIWLRGINPKNLPVLNTITGMSWKTSEKPFDIWEGRALIEGNSSLLDGLSNGEFYWKRGEFGDSEWMEKSSGKLADLAIDFVEPISPNSASVLLYPAALWEVPVGKGRILVDHILWTENIGSVKNPAIRIASVLLTNIGVKIASVVPMPKLPENIKWEPFRLASYGNMGFADSDEGDGQGGWSDQGPMMDMHRMPTGDIILNDIPFQIEPSKGCLTMRGAHQLKRDAFPLEFTGIPIARKVIALELLHAGAWVSDGIEVFKMVVHYEDGISRAVSFTGGINIRDWTSDPDAPFPLETETQTRLGWTGQGDVFKTVSMWQSRWINPFPEKVITTIDFIHGTDPTPVPLIGGLSLGIEGTAVKIEDSRTPEQLLELIQNARMAGRIDEAISIAIVLCRKVPDSTENWNLLGQLYLDKKDPRKALEIYKKSLHIQPNQPDVMNKVQELERTLGAQ